jgi:predicted transcriptional regulator
MNASLTIRLDEDQRQQLRKLASQLGKTDSEMVRDMIERGLAEESVGSRLAHLKGGLPESPAANDALSRTIRERNWRP